MGARWGFSTGGKDGNRTWFGGGTGGELSLTRDSGGPFRTEHGPCGADRDRLREEFGVPVDLVDDVLAWWTDFQERPVPTPHAWDYAHRERLLVWLAEGSRFEHGSDETRERQFAWEDEGMALRGELQRLWGPTYSVWP